MSHSHRPVLLIRWLPAALVILLGLGGAAGPAAGAVIQARPPSLPQAPGGAPMPANCGSDVVGAQISGGAIPNPGTATFNFEIDDPLAYAFWTTLATNITHPQPEDLDLMLISPSGTEVTLSTGNSNLLTGFLIGFDDAAIHPVTDAPETASLYVPEEAMGAFRGEPVVGTWQLKVTDDTAGGSGSLGDILLSIAGATSVPVTHTAIFTNSTPQLIQDHTTITSALNVSVPGSTLVDLKLRTYITHTWNNDLAIYLTSPTGSQTAISLHNGGGNDNVFNGTLWDDKAGAVNPPGPVTLATYANNVTETPLVVEGALSHFNGTNPNGNWQLTIADEGAGDSGTLASWSLIVTTGACGVEGTEKVFMPFIKR